MFLNVLRRLLIILGISQPVMAQQAIPDVSGLPPAVAKLTTTMASVPGVTSVEVNKTDLTNFDLSTLSLLGQYGDLPAATLRRSNGELPSEVLISVNFSISRDEPGLKALEFLAWWTRDHARSGDDMQLRVLALPPSAGDKVQLGQTLRFTIDWFYRDPTESIDAMMEVIDSMAESLEESLDLYRSTF